jgi:hypothetical protein
MVQIGSSANRRRRKLSKNYNSFYNSDLKNNGYLKRHPEAKSKYITKDHAYSFATTTTTSRDTIAPPILFNPPITTINRYYVMEETTHMELAAQSFEEIINEAEDGELLAMEAVTSSPDVTIEIVVYGMGNSPNIINDYSINEMIRRGRGLTPGDVETLPGGRSKDTTGLPLRYYPYIGRYKSDVFVDFLNDSREYYVVRYEPAIPMPYSSLIINVKNTSTIGGKTVDSVNIHRRVFENPNADDNLAGVPIESEMVFALPEEEEIAATTTTTTTEIPTPPNTSPYIANYLKRQKELKEQASRPAEELLPEEFY